MWHDSIDKLITRLLLPLCKRKWKSVNWDKLLDVKDCTEEEIIVHVPGKNVEHGYGDDGFVSDSGVSDIATEDRNFDGVDNSNKNIEMEVTFDRFVGSKCQVKIETLQQLKMLPEFIGNIVDSIKNNLIGAKWWEGYNKKLDCCVGNMDSGGKALPNLIILDISRSIPRGVSNTMLQLAETMVNTCKADFIVTASKSFYYEYGDDLPTPDRMRLMNPVGNESVMFHSILDNDINGKEYGTIICFGDNDNPHEAWRPVDVKCHQILGYHTWEKDKLPGYVRRIARWNPDADVKIDTEWVEWMI